MFIYQNSMVRGHLQSGSFQKSSIGPDSQRHYQGVRLNCSPRGFHLFHSFCTFCCFQLCIGHCHNAVVSQIVLYIFCHFRIKSRHNMRRHINDRCADASAHQVFRHFQSDKSASGNHSPLDLSGLRSLSQIFRILRGTHKEDILQILSFNRRCNGRSACCNDQLVIGIFFLFSGFQFQGFDPLLLSVQAGDFYPCFYFCPGKPGKGFRRIHDKLASFMDHIAYIIRQSAAGIGNVLTLGKDQHLCSPVFSF